ncbi:hypothetical protein [Prevotella sp. P5-92]|uniref:hypothetical protein n=1 Tax=Prevotella sp. P5-92 TaxID=2024222 RepID=UPI00117E3A1C|nr:hypothetical protein [Prevotella sp. P5-92]
MTNGWRSHTLTSGKNDKKYKNYCRGVGQFREEHGRATTYLTFLICALLLSALLYVAYWISMK